ncbi:hypothetical protein GJ697_04940 [Pseudoduganella sp. FT25W]|uniref:Lipoprotein n=1 Tax=Duganella alba TaxID=2666081 RepID=A0A6L5QCE9_9BURK|nr:hypothetical protein [Duganella alba]MRX07178.1 hypothetical protein [Duganella alba]MRX15127.1 hypothetical protein [Duganella alba]
MKTLTFITLLVLSFSASACRFETADGSIVREVVQSKGGYPITEKQCLLLNKSGLALSVEGAASVLRGVSVGWAKVSVIDLKTHVTSNIWRASTQVNASDASQDTADGLLYEAVRNSIGGFEFEAAIAEVNGFRAKAKSTR